MTNWKNTIGIDFGTANSHFADRNQAKVSKILWEEENPVLETAICYKEDGTIQSIGQTAAEDYGAAGANGGLSIKYWFKPEIATDPQAKKATTDYFKTTIDIHGHDSPELFPKGTPIVVGVPAKSPEEYKAALRECLVAAGLKDHPLELIPEPVGALIALIQRDKIDLRLASRNVLVVDMGAGTCDFTLIDESGKLVPWGDPCLGGRLFDDLFYQLILKFHPEADKVKHLADNDRFDLHYVICRKEKEEFSKSIHRQLAAGASAEEAKYTFRPRKLATHGLKSSLEISYQQFLDAARAYKPTDMMFTLFSENSEFYKTLKDMQIHGRDLLEWFRELLKKDGHYRNVEYVIFAGGSSKLPFVKEIIEEECGKDVGKYFPREPYRLISEGLSQLPRFRHQCRELVGLLRSNRDKFIESAATHIVDKCSEWACEAIDEIVKLTTNDIFNPVLRDAHVKGIDSKKKLKDALKHAYENRSEHFREYERYYSEKYMDEKLQKELIACRTKWLEEHAEDLDLIPIQAQQIAYSINLPVPLSKVDTTDMVFGSAVLGGVLSTIAGLLVDPTGVLLTFGLPVSAIVAIVSKSSYFANKQFQNFIQDLEDDEKRSVYLAEYAEKSAAEMKKRLFGRNSKKRIGPEQNGYDRAAIKKMLSKSVADTAIASVQKLIENFSPENLR